MRRTTRNNGRSLDGAFLYPCLRNRCTRMVTCFSGIDSHSHEYWFCHWRSHGWWVAYSTSGELLVVCLSLSHILLLVLTIEQTKYYFVFPIRLYTPCTFPDHQPKHPCTTFPPSCLHKWYLYWIGAELYTCSSPASHAARNTFHDYFPPCNIPRLRWFFWICDWWWSVRARLESEIRERVRRKWWNGRKRGSGEEIVR